MDQLPHEILIRIFEYVNIHPVRRHIYMCTLVNRAFYRTANPVLWQCQYGEEDTYNKILTVLKAAKHPTVLGKLIHSIMFILLEWSDDDFLFLMQHTPHLQRLSLLAPTNITDTSLQRMPPYCPHLTSFYISDSPVGQPTIQALAQHCPELTCLHLHNCHQLGPDALSDVVSLPLEQLNLTNPGPSDMHLPPTYFPHLTHLALNEWNDMSNVDRILREGVTAWPLLTKLSITRYKHNSSTSTPLPCFVRSHPHLTCLSLANGFFSDSLLQAFSTFQHPGIQSLRLANNREIKHLAVRRLVLAWPRLNDLNIMTCGISRHWFPEASTNCLLFKDNPELHKPRSHLACLDQQAIINIRLSDAAAKESRKQ